MIYKIQVNYIGRPNQLLDDMLSAAVEKKAHSSGGVLAQGGTRKLVWHFDDVVSRDQATWRLQGLKRKNKLHFDITLSATEKKEVVVKFTKDT